MAYRTEASLVTGSKQGSPRLEPEIPEAAMVSADVTSPPRPRHFGAAPRHAGHARPLGGCRSFDLSDAFDRLDGNY
jgi:hypothetical protein